MPATRRTVTDALPRIALRFDDGSWTQIREIALCLERGLHVGLALNFSNLREFGATDPGQSNGRMRKADLRWLQSKAAANGVKIHPIQHGNTNFNGYAGFTWQDILDELDPTAMEDFFEQKVRSFVMPGDTGLNAWGKQHRTLIVDALLEHGIEYAVGLVDSPSSSDMGDVPGVGQGILNSANDLLDISNLSNGFQNSGGLSRPGVTVDPFAFLGGWTFDLGSTVVHRGVAGSPPTRSPKSGAEGWMLGQDNNGNGVEGSLLGDFHKTAQFKIYRALAQNLSVGIAMHGGARSDEVVFGNLSSGRGSAGTPSTLPGHFSVRHLVDFLLRLESAGHCKVTHPDGWLDYNFSDFAEGVDVIQNPTWGIPQIDADELEGGFPHIPLPRGLTSKGPGINSFGSSGWAIDLPADANGDGRFDDVTPLVDVIGAGVSGVFGAPGGVALKALNTSDFGGYNFGQAMLAPGLYQLKLWASELTTGALAIRDFAAAGVRMSYKSEDNTADNEWHSFTEFALPVADDFRQSFNLNAAGEMPLEFYLLLPKSPQAIKTQRVSGTVNALATGSGAFFSTVAIPGFVPGKGYRVLSQQALPAGCHWRLDFTTEGNGSLFLMNNSGGPVTINGGASFEALVIVEVDDNEKRGTNRGPTNRFVYSFHMTMAKDTDTRAVLSRPSLRLLSRDI